jgi:hypothetical protein
VSEGGEKVSNGEGRIGTKKAVSALFSPSGFGAQMGPRWYTLTPDSSGCRILSSKEQRDKIDCSTPLAPYFGHAERVGYLIHTGSILLRS